MRYFIALTGGMNRLNGWIDLMSLGVKHICCKFEVKHDCLTTETILGSKIESPFAPPSRLQFLGSQSSADGRLLEASGWKQSNFG